jgi:hypothetical protein
MDWRALLKIRPSADLPPAQVTVIREAVKMPPEDMTQDELQTARIWLRQNRTALQDKKQLEEAEEKQLLENIRKRSKESGETAEVEKLLNVPPLKASPDLVSRMEEYLPRQEESVRIRIRNWLRAVQRASNLPPEIRDILSTGANVATSNQFRLVSKLLVAPGLSQDAKAALRGWLHNAVVYKQKHKDEQFFEDLKDLEEIADIYTKPPAVTGWYDVATMADARRRERSPAEESPEAANQAAKLAAQEAREKARKRREAILKAPTQEPVRSKKSKSKPATIGALLAQLSEQGSLIEKKYRELEITVDQNLASISRALDAYNASVTDAQSLVEDLLLEEGLPEELKTALTLFQDTDSTIEFDDSDFEEFAENFSVDQDDEGPVDMINQVLEAAEEENVKVNLTESEKARRKLLRMKKTKQPGAGLGSPIFSPRSTTSFDDLLRRLQQK